MDTVLIDQETVYAPRQSNDRLLLGLKGSLNEYELDLLRERSVEARHGRCGRKLTVRYTGSQHEVSLYACNRGWLDHGEPRCIAFGGVPVDDSISKQVLAAVQLAAIEAALLASEEQIQHQDDAIAALERDLKAARRTASAEAI